MKKEYIIVGSDNFWYGSAIKSLKEAEKELRYIKKNIAEYGERGKSRASVPEKFYIFEARLVKETK